MLWKVQMQISLPMSAISFGDPLLMRKANALIDAEIMGPQVQAMNFVSRMLCFIDVSWLLR